jgi:hypothetical protein
LRFLDLHDTIFSNTVEERGNEFNEGFFNYSGNSCAGFGWFVFSRKKNAKKTG